ncbi:hypothetical protein SAMN05428978_102029 [Nitrosomonas sp. Nm34]|nr:hypothetical protein SAMN05428978_102029 [Nitrosomonas sp. Nm34]
MKKGTLPVFIVFMHKKNNMALESFCNILSISVQCMRSIMNWHYRKGDCYDK